MDFLQEGLSSASDGPFDQEDALGTGFAMAENLAASPGAETINPILLDVNAGHDYLGPPPLSPPNDAQFSFLIDLDNDSPTSFSTTHSFGLENDSQFQLLDPDHYDPSLSQSS